MAKARVDLAPKSSEEKTRDASLYELDLKFDPIEGHTHDGINSPKIRFDDLISINIDHPTNGEVLKWDASLSSWVNNTLVEADIANLHDFEEHTSATISVHGITNTSDLALKSGSINQFADITSSGINIEDAVTKRHIQNTDVGTSSTTFYLGLGGPKIKGNSGIVEVRNNADTNYADLVVQNLTVKGTAMIVESETVTFNSNVLTLNNNYTGSTPLEKGGLEVQRGSLANASITWDESSDLWKAGLAGNEKTIIREGNTVTLTGNTTGTAAFDTNGNINISVQVLDDSHNHTISNIDNLQTSLNDKSDITHDHDSTYLKLTGGTLSGNLIVPEIHINSSNTKIQEGYGNTVSVVTPYGYINIGPQNESSAYFVTGQSYFYFNKPIEVKDQLKIFNTGTYFTSSEGRIDSNIIWHAGNDGPESGLDADLLDGKHSTDFATSTHDHNSTYLGINSTAVDSDKLDGYDGIYYLIWDHFTNTPTTLSGYGITDAALKSDLDSHTSATISVHGIANTSDLALKSGSINQFADITSSGTDIDDAVLKRHIQNTDVGTSSMTFYIGLNGPKIKNNSGTIEVRNNIDSDYANLIVNNLIVKGTTTTTTSETILFDDNILILNNNYSGSSPTINGGFEIERGSLTNASLIWDESNDLWKAGLVNSERTIVLEDNTITLTGGVSGSGTFNSVGNVSISVQVLDNSHNHTILNIDNLQTSLDNKSDITHNHDSNYLGITATAVNSDKLNNYEGTYYLDWSNFTNTPTTLSGYGITDATSITAFNEMVQRFENLEAIVETIGGILI